ncbi:MAG: amidohydrolase family protein [Candidatus Shapirobacteria bacterium]|jgi:hypothetical protein
MNYPDTIADVDSLDCLPYFERDEEGNLKIKAQYQLPAIDMHIHLNQHRAAAGETKTYFPTRGCVVHLSKYSAFDFSPQLKKRCQRRSIRAIISRRGIEPTATLDNLMLAMNRLGIVRCAAMAIDGFRPKNSLRLLEQCRKSEQKIIPFVSIHPLAPGAVKILGSLKENGGVGLKIHPPIQLVKPDNKKVIALVNEAGKMRMPVLFHCGQSPLLPPLTRRFEQMTSFLNLIWRCPETTIILGHAGIMEYEEAARLAAKFDNVFLEVSGQPPEAIKEMWKTASPDKLLFGSDWPYYPMALPLAKVLLATEGEDEIRKKILFKNVTNIFKNIR